MASIEDQTQMVAAECTPDEENEGSHPIDFSGTLIVLETKGSHMREEIQLLIQCEEQELVA